MKSNGIIINGIVNGIVNGVVYSNGIVYLNGYSRYYDSLFLVSRGELK